MLCTRLEIAGLPGVLSAMGATNSSESEAKDLVVEARLLVEGIVLHVQVCASSECHALLVLPAPSSGGGMRP